MIVQTPANRIIKSKKVGNNLCKIQLFINTYQSGQIYFIIFMKKKNEKRDKRKNQQLYIFFKHMDKNYKSTVTLINA